MKKSTKILALSLAVLPCALVLTACGGNKNVVLEGYKDANYAETTPEAFSEQLQARNQVTIQGLKEKATLSLTLQAAPGVPATELEITNNAIVSGITQTDGFDKAQAKTDVTIKNGDESRTANAYYKDYTLFADLSDLGLDELAATPGMPTIPEKFSYNLAQDTTGVTAADEGFVFDLETVYDWFSDPEGMGQQIMQYASSWESATEGDTYTVKVTFNGTQVLQLVTGLVSDYGVTVGEGSEISKLEVYLVFGKTSFEGIAVNLEGKLNVSYANMAIAADVKLNVEVATTTESAKLPSGLNTEKYPELDMSQFAGMLPQA